MQTKNAILMRTATMISIIVLFGMQREHPILMTNHLMEKRKSMMGPGWKWNRWEDNGIDDVIPGPALVDLYNGPHGLRP
eukprot:14560448-Ditylum_brightwellii.AAC.1